MRASWTGGLQEPVCSTLRPIVIHGLQPQFDPSLALHQKNVTDKSSDVVHEQKLSDTSSPRAPTPLSRTGSTAP